MSEARERFIDHLTEAWVAACDGGTNADEDYVVHLIGKTVDNARGDGWLLDELARRVNEREGS